MTPPHCAPAVSLPCTAFHDRPLPRFLLPQLRSTFLPVARLPVFPVAGERDPASPVQQRILRLPAPPRAAIHRVRVLPPLEQVESFSLVVSIIHGTKDQFLAPKWAETWAVFLVAEAFLLAFVSYYGSNAQKKKLRLELPI